MADLPTMPLYTDALLSDAGDLPNVLFGAYVRLLCRWWREAALPEPNEKRLARWAGVTSTEFEDLKEFLTKTELGWTQRKLFETYARQMEKSIKARNAANAKHGQADAPEVINERIADAYASRGVPHLPSMNHEPTVEAKASTERKKIKTKKKEREIVSRETFKWSYPEDDVCCDLIRRLEIKWSAKILAPYLMIGDEPAMVRDGEKIIIRAISQVRADRVDQKIGGDLDVLAGRGNWEIRVIADLKAAA